MALPSPVNRRKRCLYPVVQQRVALVNQLQGLLRDLERVAKPVVTAEERAPGGTVIVTTQDEGEYIGKLCQLAASTSIERDPEPTG